MVARGQLRAYPQRERGLATLMTVVSGLFMSGWLVADSRCRERVTGIEPALSAWEPYKPAGSIGPTCG
jgi:hypothetical protein